MAVIIVTKQSLNSGASTGTGFSNSATLSKLSTDSKGNLTFNGSIVGEKSIEVALNVTLTKQHVAQKFIPLPHDCDTSKIITLCLNGISLTKGTFWEVSEKDYPENDLIAWNGLELQNLAQDGDSVSISYYKKL